MTTVSKGALFVLSEPTLISMGIVNDVYQDRINVTFWAYNAKTENFTRDIEVNSDLFNRCKFYNTPEEKSELAKRCIKYIKEDTNYKLIITI